MAASRPDDHKPRFSIAKERIEKCFSLIEKKLPAGKVKQLGIHLKQQEKIDVTANFDKPDRRSIMSEIKSNVISFDYDTYECILQWLETKCDFRTELKDESNSFLEQTLLALFKDGRKTYSPGTNQGQLLEDLARSRNLVLSSECEKGNIYPSISSAMGNIDVAELYKNIELFLSSEVPLNPNQVKAILQSKEPVTIQEHAKKYQQKTYEDPFIFHAVARLRQVQIHVLSAVSLEEYIFYPHNLPSGRSGRQKIFIGHKCENKYISLKQTDEREEYERKISELTETVTKLKQRVIDLEYVQQENKDHKEQIEEERKKTLYYKGEIERLSREFEELKNKNIHLKTEVNKRFEELEKEILKLKNHSETSERVESPLPHLDGKKAQMPMYEDEADLEKIKLIAVERKSQLSLTDDRHKISSKGANKFSSKALDKPSKPTKEWNASCKIGYPLENHGNNSNGARNIKQNRSARLGSNGRSKVPPVEISSD